MTTSLAKTIIYNNLPEVAQVLEQQPDEINEFDEYGFNPLVEAAIFDKNEIAKFLLSKGAKVDFADMTGRTALHWAADHRNKKLAHLLLEHGADPNAYSHSRQPVLAFPFLRGQEDMKALLLDHGADLDFAKDFVNTKLIGHRYELQGKVHILDAKQNFVLLEYEGFFLEFSLNIIEESLKRFKRNFGAKQWLIESQSLEQIIRTIERGRQLIKFQHHTPLYKKFERQIDSLLDAPLIFLPVAYEGHAISCVSMRNLWIKIDRGWNSKLEGSVVIYEVTRPEWLTKAFFKHLLYKKHSREYVNEGLNEQIGLVKRGELTLPPQTIGNCSWANVEGAIAAMMFLLSLRKQSQLDQQAFLTANQSAKKLFYDWREWDKDRALEECLQDFYHANTARKATKAALMAAVLVQKCSYHSSRDLARAEKILNILALPDYQFILDAYIKVFIHQQKTGLGENLINLLDLAAPKDMVIHLHQEGLSFLPEDGF